MSGDLSQTLIMSARLTLRAFTAADAAETFTETSARITKYMSWNTPTSEEEFKVIWQRDVSNMKAGKVDWNPSVIEEARKTGLSVDDDGNLVVRDAAN